MILVATFLVLSESVSYQSRQIIRVGELWGELSESENYTSQRIIGKLSESVNYPSQQINQVYELLDNKFKY